MKAAAREERNARIMQLFVGGATYRQILATLRADEEQGIRGGKPRAPGWALRSTGAVHKIVQLELAASAQRRAILTDEAFSLQQERTERLFAAHWAIALDPTKPGTHRSAELCRRILAQQSRLYELGGDGGTALPAPTGPGPRPDDDGDEEELDELAKLRAAREA